MPQSKYDSIKFSDKNREKQRQIKMAKWKKKVAERSTAEAKEKFIKEKKEKEKERQRSGSGAQKKRSPQALLDEWDELARRRDCLKSSKRERLQRRSTRGS